MNNYTLNLLTEKEHNVYYVDNCFLFDKLLTLVEDNQYGYMNVLRLNKNYNDVVDWMNNNLVLLRDVRYTTATKVCWILHGLIDFPTCQQCGIPFDVDHIPVRMANTNPFVCYGDKKFCSKKCTYWNKDVQLKKKQTNLSRHNATNWTNREKAQTTIFEKYGDNAYALFYKWSCEAKNEIYGDPYYNNSQKISASHAARTDEQKRQASLKAQQTYFEKTGYFMPSQNEDLKPIIAEHIQSTMLKNYGVTSYAKTQQFKDFMVNHNLSAYGKEHFFQTDTFKQKSKATMLERYGAESFCQTQEFKDLMSDPEVNAERMKKQFETKKLNGTLRTSAPEARCLLALQNKFGTDDIETQHISDAYPFHCDFYIKSLNLYIELNAHWSHGGHFFDERSIDDVAKLNAWLDKKTSYYDNCAYTWSVLDVKKRRCASENDLNYLVFWTEDEMLRWIDIEAPNKT